MKPKRTISAVGRRRIAAAQCARWEKVKREAKAAWTAGENLVMIEPPSGQWRSRRLGLANDL